MTFQKYFIKMLNEVATMTLPKKTGSRFCIVGRVDPDPITLYKSNTVYWFRVNPPLFC
jgi:hypothetical protein